MKNNIRLQKSFFISLIIEIILLYFLSYISFNKPDSLKSNFKIIFHFNKNKIGIKKNITKNKIKKGINSSKKKVIKTIKKRKTTNKNIHFKKKTKIITKKKAINPLEELFKNEKIINSVQNNEINNNLNNIDVASDINFVKKYIKNKKNDNNLIKPKIIKSINKKRIFNLNPNKNINKNIKINKKIDLSEFKTLPNSEINKNTKEEEFLFTGEINNVKNNSISKDNNFPAIMASPYMKAPTWLEKSKDFFTIKFKGILDNNGNLKFLTLIHSSGYYKLDIEAQQFIQEKYKWASGYDNYEVYILLKTKYSN